MTGGCGHRRRRPALAALFAAAVATIALNYGLIVGTARGHADDTCTSAVSTDDAP